MKPFLMPSLAALTLAACAAPNVTTQAPSPPRAPTSSAGRNASASGRIEPTEVPRATVDTPPSNWQLLDELDDQMAGISVLRAEHGVLEGKAPKQTVVVAVIDGGLDTADVDLLPHIWHNPGEIPGNGKDDDHNGYVDDTWGWDFIGGRDGKDIDHETKELTRLYARCKHMKPVLSMAGSPPSAAQCAHIEAEFPAKRDTARQTLTRVDDAAQAAKHAYQILGNAIGDSLTAARVKAFTPVGPDEEQAKSIYLRLADAHITRDLIAEAQKHYESEVNFYYDTTYDPRPAIVGDNLMDLNQRDYGNRDVTGPDALHGSHVAGIIGAILDPNEGIQGIAQSARIMMVRTVPDGDERDKDVANAIRYAVVNGARVINMSFGKEYSPQKSAVDAAVKYADAHGVLMVHAAGNDGKDVDQSHDFPTPYYLDGGQAKNWIEVGASSWKGGDSLAAPFSNYGQKRVDVFAPGQDVLSTVAHNKFRRESGTSMAAPVVAGLAALILSYYPDLSASEVKEIILESAARYPAQLVAKPGSKPGTPLVPFGTLSVTGGIVNAYMALQMAGRMAAAKH